MNFNQLPLILLAVACCGCQSTRPNPVSVFQSDVEVEGALVEDSTVESTIVDGTTVIPVSFQAVAIEGPRSIEALVELGLAQNPRIAEAEAKIQSLRHRIPQVTALPDPMLNTTSYLAPVQTAAGEQSFGLGISQKFTRSERRETQAAIVCNEIEAAESALLAIAVELAADIRKVGYQLDFVRQAISITMEDQESLAMIASVVQNQYEVKPGISQEDLLNIQVEQSKIENSIVELQQKEKTLRARLARLVHLDPRSDFALEEFPTLSKQELNQDALLAEAEQMRPDLQAQLANIQRDQRKTRLAELESLPDYTVGLNWVTTSRNGISPVANGDDALMLGIGMNLPIRKSRVLGGIAEARANTIASSHRLESLKDMAAEEVYELVAGVESIQETLSLIREDIIPKTERSADLALESYKTGTADYVQLIENWRTLLRYRLNEKRLESELRQTIASLNASLGNIDPPVLSASPLN